MKRKNPISGIYCIENIINHKKYIGLSIDIYNRFSAHRVSLKKKIHDNIYLQNSWYKYGKENFIFYIIQELPPEEDMLKDMEIYWIAYYNSFVRDGGGYNLTRGGEGLFGYKYSDEMKKRLSESKMGDKNPNFGKSPSEETRKKSSISHSGENSYWLGKHHSEETLKIMFENTKNQIFTEETKGKMSKSHMGMKQTQETKDKLSKIKSGKKRGGKTSSTHVGVYYDKFCNKWRARITLNKLKIDLGRFKTEQEAIDAWENKYTEYLRGLEENKNEFS